MTIKESYRLDELADRWGVHEMTVRRLIADGELTVRSSPGSLRVLLDSILKYESQGGAMKKALLERDFAETFLKIPPYAEEKKKLDDLITKLTAAEIELAEIRKQLVEESDIKSRAKLLLDDDSAQKKPGTLREQGASLQREIRAIEEAIRLQRDRVDDARRKSSHRFCEMIKSDVKQQIISPVLQALKNLARAVAAEREFHERLRDTDIADSFTGTHMPLGDPREEDSLFNLKIQEIKDDYDLE